MQITKDESNVLGRLYLAGTPLTLRPIGNGPIAMRAFNRELARTLLSLETRGLIRIDPAASQQVSTLGESVLYSAITAVLTEAGREALLSRDAQATWKRHR
jgi:hypothetical protein